MVRDRHRRIALKDHGKIVTKYQFGTPGDGQPGGEFNEGSQEVLKIRGHFPSYDPDLGWCALVSRLIG